MNNKEKHLGFVKKKKGSSHLFVDVALLVGKEYKMFTFAVPPEQVESMKIDEGMEVHVTIPSMEDQFCKVADVVEPYGHCVVCKERFTYGNDHLRISVVANWQSQGYPTQDTREDVDVHPTCFTPELLKKLKLHKE